MQAKLALSAARDDSHIQAPQALWQELPRLHVDPEEEILNALHPDTPQTDQQAALGEMKPQDATSEIPESEPDRSRHEHASMQNGNDHSQGGADSSQNQEEQVNGENHPDDSAVIQMDKRIREKRHIVFCIQTILLDRTIGQGLSAQDEAGNLHVGYHVQVSLQPAHCGSHNLLSNALLLMLQGLDRMQEQSSQSLSLNLHYLHHAFSGRCLSKGVLSWKNGCNFFELEGLEGFESPSIAGLGG